MVILSIILIGIIVGVFFTLDLFYKRKENGSFLKSLLYLFTTLIPALYQSTFGDISINDDSFSNYWINYFYPSFIIVIFLTILIIRYTTYRLLMKRLLISTVDRDITFLDFFYSGYKKFKEDLIKSKEKNEKILQKQNRDIISAINKTHPHLKEFFHKMLETINNTDTNGYIYYFLSEFINRFFGTSNGRFTFRKLSADNKKMEAFITTSVAIPKPIPIDKKNLITLSQKTNKPILYSENMRNHYKTENDSYGKKIYDEYVSYCLLETNDGKPYMSLSLDVKGKENVNKLQSFVKTQVFQLLCQVLIIKILNNE